MNENLFEIMANGPDDLIRMTRNAQPALFATSIAAVRVLESKLGMPLSEKNAVCAGHSLGEYSALAAAGSLQIGDAAKLLRQRGDAMQEAVPVGAGAMAAIRLMKIKLALSSQKIKVLLKLPAITRWQIVISGADAVDKAIDEAKAAGAVLSDYRYRHRSIVD